MSSTIYITLLLVLITVASYGQSIQSIIQRGHEQAVLAVGISPDSNYVATGSRDRVIKLWELSTGREVRSYFGHESSINALDFSSDGKLMISSGAEGVAKIWDVESGKELFSTPPEAKRLTSVAFSPDQKFFVTGGYPDEVKIWDLKTKKVIQIIKVNSDQGTGYGINVIFSPDSQWLAIGEDNKIANVYRTGTWENAYTFKYESGWCGGCPTWTAFSPDSKFLYKASNKGPLRKHSLTDGSLVLTYANDVQDVVGLSISKDNKELTLITKDSILTYDAQSSKELYRHAFLMGRDEVSEGKLSQSPGIFAIARANNTAILYDARTGETKNTLTGILNQRDKGGVMYDPNSYWESHIAKYIRLKNDILLSADGTSLIKGKLGTKLKRWDIASGRTIREYVGHDKAPICYELSNDGTKLLTGGADGKIMVWNLETGDSIYSIKANRDPIFSVRFGADENTVLSSSWDATLKIFDLKTGKQLHYFDFRNASVYDAQWGKNDLYVFTSQLDLSLKMYEVDTKKVVRDFIGHDDVVSTIRLTKDYSNLLSCSWDGTVRLWDVSTGLMDRKFTGHKGAVYISIFSNDEKYVFSGGADRKIIMWDISTGKAVNTFEGHQSEVTSIIQSKDGNLLITHSTDGVTKFWDLKSGKEFFEHILIGENDWMVKNPAGYFTGTDNARRSIHFVNGLKTYSVDQFFDDFYRPDLLPTLFKSRGESAPKESIQGKLQKSPPPMVKVATIKTSNPTELEVYIKVTDQGGGVKDVTLYHNGKSVPVKTSGTKLPSGKNESAVFKQLITPIGGKNVFTATASNKDRIESDPSSVDYFSQYATKSSVCYIMAVGINEYENQKLSLNYAKSDAEAFSSILNQKSSGLFKDIKLVTLYDKEASSKNILNKLDELVAQVNTEDVFIFYYAGHGSMVDNQFFFVPTEGKRLYDIKSLREEAIEASVLQEKLGNIKALKQLIVMDACQSGGSVELLATRGSAEEKAIAQLSRSAGIHVMAAAGSEQFATEFTELGHGVFTYVLIKALGGAADGAPKDGKVTIYELKSYIDDQVPELTQKIKGEPQYPYTFSRGQDFPVVLEE